LTGRGEEEYPASTIFGARPCVPDRAAASIRADDRHGFASVFEKTREHSRELLGRELDLYVTEFGFTTYNHWRKPGWPRGYTEAAQAAYSVRALILALAAGAKATCLYQDFMDDGTDPCEAEPNFGLVRHEKLGYERKPAFDAVKRLLSVLGERSTHLERAPAVLGCPMRPLPRSYFWQAEPAEPFMPEPAPTAEWFSVDGRHVAFVWLSGRARGESPPPVGRFFWPQAPAGLHSATVIDLVSGAEETRKLERPRRLGMDGEGLILGDVPVAPEPRAVVWHGRGGAGSGEGADRGACLGDPRR
jgi:hypothetical protein